MPPRPASHPRTVIDRPRTETMTSLSNPNESDNAQAPLDGPTELAPPATASGGQPAADELDLFRDILVDDTSLIMDNDEDVLNLASSVPVRIEDASPAAERTFHTRGLPPLLAELATNAGWLDRIIEDGPYDDFTGRELIQDEDIFPCPALSDEPDASLPPGSSLRCGRAPPMSSTAACTLLLPKVSSATSGCSTLLVHPTDHLQSESFDFLLATETETTVTHSHVHETRYTLHYESPEQPWAVTREPGRDCLVGPNEETRDYGCGCQAGEIECKGCGVQVGYTLHRHLLSRPACPRHPDGILAFDPDRVHLVPPPPSRTSSKKRKRPELEYKSALEPAVADSATFSPDASTLRAFHRALRTTESRPIRRMGFRPIQAGPRSVADEQPDARPMAGEDNHDDGIDVDTEDETNEDPDRLGV